MADDEAIELLRAVDKTSLSAAAAPVLSLKPGENYLNATLLDSIVWLSSFHKESEFSLARSSGLAHSSAFFLRFLYSRTPSDRSPLIEPGINGEESDQV